MVLNYYFFTIYMYMYFTNRSLITLSLFSPQVNISYTAQIQHVYISLIKYTIISLTVLGFFLFNLVINFIMQESMQPNKKTSNAGLISSIYIVLYSEDMQRHQHSSYNFILQERVLWLVIRKKTKYHKSFLSLKLSMV